MFKSKNEKLQQQIKQGERDNRRSQRELERERAQLQRDELNIQSQIKKLAASGNKVACSVLAKQLVQNRQQQARTYEMGSKLSGISTQQKLMGTNQRMADSLKNTTVTMAKMNKQIDPATTAKIMQDFSKESLKLSMSEDVMDDVLADVMGDNEEEENAVVQQVLDELGIETSSKIAGAPTPARGSIAPDTSTEEPDSDVIDAQLERLRSL